jgi:hypothetical protein
MGGGIFVEADGVLDHLLRLRAGQRLVVGEEVGLAAEVQLGLLVVAAVDGLVGALEEAVFAVGDELAAGRGVAGREVGDAVGGQHHGGGDVVLGLQFGGGPEVLAQGEETPGAVLVVANAQAVLDQLGLAVFQHRSRARR